MFLNDLYLPDAELCMGEIFKNAGDELRPRQYYLDKWGYSVGPHASISYGPNAKVVSPRPQPKPEH